MSRSQEQVATQKQQQQRQTRQRPKRPPSLADFLIQFRWIVVIPIILPLSFLFYQFVKWLPTIWCILHGPPSEESHRRAVERVRQRVKQRDPSSDGLICTGRRPWLGVALRNAEHKRGRRYEVDLAELRNVVWLDRARGIIKVEPMVTMSQLSAATLPHGIAPEVLPELDDLTVGGVINGYGIEGSSHIYGLFAETCSAFELVLADGQVVRATEDNEYSDLFKAVPWSHGSIGLLVGVEIRLIPVKEFMKVTYTPVTGSLDKVAEVYMDLFCPRDLDQENPEKVPDFVEGIVYSGTTAVITTGRYASREEAMKKGNVVNDYSWWWKPHFHIHAQTAIERGTFVEYVPVRSYYHRHTRSLYWEGELIVPMGNHPLFRLLLGWLMPPKVSLLKLTQTDGIRKYYIQRHACQDMLVPNRKLAECLEFCHENFETYPLWLCPHRLFKNELPTMLNTEPGYTENKFQGDTDYAQMWCDVGIWGVPGAVLRHEVWDGVEATKNMEKWLRDNGSYQCLYAEVEQTEEEFWKMFNPTLYNAVRKKYEADSAFMSVYYKISKSKKGKQTATKRD